MRVSTIIAASLLLALPAAAQTIRTAVKIDANTAPLDHAVGHVMATQGDVSVACWTEYGTGYYWSAVSDGIGATWQPPVRVDDSTGTTAWSGYQGNSMPACVSGNHIYTAWKDDRNGQAEVLFARSTDSGATWEANQALDYAAGAVRVFDFSMAVAPDPDGNPDQDQIYILMVCDMTGTSPYADELFMVTSMDGGASFSTAKSASTENGSGTDAGYINIWAEPDTVHILWSDDRAGDPYRRDVHYRRSDDAGASWAMDEIQLDTGLNGDVEYDMQIRAQGELVVAQWTEELTSTNEQVRVATSTDGGDTWNADIQVGNYDPAFEDVDYAVMEIAANGNIIVAWEDNRTGLDEVYAATSSDNGASFSETLVSTGGGQYPRLAVSASGAVGIIWTGNCVACDGTDDEARVTFSIDFGASWAADFEIATTLGDADFAAIDFNDAAGNFLHTWEADDKAYTLDNLWAGGFADACGGSVVHRNGGVNPDSYRATEPWNGGAMYAEIDLTTTGHALALLVGFSTPFSFTLGNGATLLVNIADSNGELLAQLTAGGPLATYTIDIPLNPAFCGFTAYTQALQIGAVSPFALSNAQDVTVSGF